MISTIFVIVNTIFVIVRLDKPMIRQGLTGPKTIKTNKTIKIYFVKQTQQSCVIKYNKKKLPL
jgi:hypothetical protein